MANPLDTYLTNNSINDAEFAPKIGRDRTMVSKIRRGIVRPTLDLAATIERVTGGQVPMKAWIADEADAEADAA